MDKEILYTLSGKGQCVFGCKARWENEFAIVLMYSYIWLNALHVVDKGRTVVAYVVEQHIRLELHFPEFPLRMMLG